MARKNPAAVALGRRGGKAPHSKPQGTAALTPEERARISRLGVEARKKKREESQ